MWKEPSRLSGLFWAVCLALGSAAAQPDPNDEISPEMAEMLEMMEILQEYGEAIEAEAEVQDADRPKEPPKE